MTDVWKKHQEKNWEPFEYYKIRLHINDVVGGKPLDPKIIEGWVNSTNKKKSEEERQAIIAAHLETLPDAVEEKQTKQSCVFSRVGGQLVLECRQIKAMLKENANITKDLVPTSDGNGIKNLKSKVADQVFVMGTYVDLYRTEPDETLERPISVITVQGPRTSIKRVEIVRDTEIVFFVKRKRGNGKMDVPESVLMAILDYAQSNGLGADRSQGYGTFEVLEVKKVTREEAYKGLYETEPRV